MMEDYGALSGRLASLYEEASRLAARLSQATEDLQSGVVADGSITDDLVALRTRFARVCSEVARFLELSDTLPSTPPDPVSPLLDLMSLLSAAIQDNRDRADFEAVRSRAISVLERVLAIAHRDQDAFLPLLECQSRARQLQRAIVDIKWPDRHPETDDLAEGRHAYCDLVTLVERQDELDDDRFAFLVYAVGERFSKALSIAAARGKLIIADGHVPGGDSALPLHSERSYGAGQSAAAAESSVEAAATEEVALPEDTLAGAVEVETAVEIEASPAGNGATQLSVRAGEAAVVDITQRGRDVSEEPHAAEGVETLRPLSDAGRIDTQTEGLIEELEEQHDLYLFSPDHTAQHVAATILSGASEERGRALRDLIWRLLLENKVGLAFHLARCLEILHGDTLPHLPSWLVRAAALGPHVRDAAGALSHLLKEDFAAFNEDCFAAGKAEWNHAVRFLLAAAAMRPALLAPGTGASTILHELRMKEGLNRLYEHCRIIADYGDRNQALDPNALKRVRDEAAWQSEMDSLLRETEAWYSRATRTTITYVPAAKVWRKWLEPNGLVHSLLLPVRRNDLGSLETAKQNVARLSDEAEIKREVNRTDSSVLGRRIAGGITAAALSHIVRHVVEAVQFVRHWIDLQETRPGQRKSYLQERAAELRQEVSTRQDAVLEELSSFERHNCSLLMLASVDRCRRAIENVWTLFDPDEPFPVSEPYPTHLLHGDLLKIPTLGLNERWDPETEEYVAIVNGILRLVAGNHLGWREAFDARSEARDHESTLRIVEYLERQPDDSIDLSELCQLREKRLRECQTSLRRDAEETSRQVEGAMALGLLKEVERDEYAARTIDVENAAPETLRFAQKHRVLESIREAIAGKREMATKDVEHRLGSVEIGQDHAAHGRIAAVLAAGDVLTANEYVDMVLSGQPLPQVEAVADRFASFFPQAAKAIADFMEPPSPANRPDQIIADLRNYAKGGHGLMIGPVDMHPVRGNQAAQAAEMLEAWFTVKKTQRIDESSPRRILSGLGFGVHQTTVTKAGRRTWINLTAEPGKDRTRCPVSVYGSQANGRYRILCVWERPTEEDLLSDVGDTFHGGPVLVFHFGRVTEKVHRDLARLCRERRRTFIVIDDTLVLYLCGERGSRLPVMFDCALPFTFVEPYTTTAGLVPPEMFYGRRQERDSVIDPMGSCFIYGGRQLGKTALLRDVERNFHAPQDGRIALWIDLKVHGIGYDRSIDEIWNLLTVELKRLNVLPASTSIQTGVEKLLARIEHWLEQDEKRRIILLLDEADKFLEHDGKRNDGGGGEFVRAARLKGLMDRTNRRFKVVFAGLHNVQRTTRLANHPLAHYGEPICIGPLLSNGEWREARALIERPLSSIGYRFESPDLVTRILSQTNYYPSLIQLYCNQLLRHVSNPNVAMFDPKTSPPYVITTMHVENAYQSQELRKAIRDRFMLTLDLDPRYRLIAFCMALYSGADGNDGTEDGFSVAWIREQALTFWPLGFQGTTSEDSLRVLLDEMVGLGVLRLIGKGRFALRSPNVVSLIGTREEIEAELESSAEREPPLEYEPATFRSIIRSGDNVDLSPLAAQQESELRARRNGVSIIFGSGAAGMDELERFLGGALGSQFFTPLGVAADKSSLMRVISDVIARSDEGTTLVFVPPACQWTEQWVTEAMQRVGRLKSKVSFIRLVFAADPWGAWRLIGEGPTGFDPSTLDGLTIFSLKPWHDAALRQWLQESAFGPSDRPGRQRITVTTGNWPVLLKRLYRSCQPDPHLWERFLDGLNASLSEASVARDFARSFGLDREEARVVLRDLAILGEATSRDLAGLVERVPAETVQRSLTWAHYLSLATPVGGDRWQIDPVVGRLVVSLGD